jgi:hypothetical protein
MPDQPWNRSFSHPNILRVWDAPEIPRTIDEALRRRSVQVCTCRIGDEFTPDSTDGCPIHGAVL